MAFVRVRLNWVGGPSLGHAGGGEGALSEQGSPAVSIADMRIGWFFFGESADRRRDIQPQASPPCPSGNTLFCGHQPRPIDIGAAIGGLWDFGQT